MRRFAFVAVALLAGSLSCPARAAGECPEGDWFCDTAPIPEEPPTEPESHKEPLDEPAPVPPSTRTSAESRVRIQVERVQPPKRRQRRFREWGVNLHVGLGLMGNDELMASDAGMNGMGAALRFRPIPHIAIEGSVELLWGIDYNGFDRFEDALLVNALFFANPRSAVQVYGVAGIGGGHAYLDSGTAADGLPVLRDERYSYLGMQLGFGVEARVTRHFALGGDLLGFLRGRTDRSADDNPEFVDPGTHRTTNTSGGGLVRLGATFYW
jgi:opacity protein-like surface antigen